MPRNDLIRIERGHRGIERGNELLLSHAKNFSLIELRNATQFLCEGLRA